MSTEHLTEPHPDPAPTPLIDWMSPILKDQGGPDSFIYQSWQEQTWHNPIRGKGLGKPESMLQFPKCGEIRDIEGILWDVREIRATKHGFNLYFGTPTYHPGGHLCGKLRLIATPELSEFWADNKLKSHGFLYDLPAGRTTLKRLRSRIGFNWRDDSNEFWDERIGDLKKMTAREFAAKHGVSRTVARDRYTRLFGSRARPKGWWRKPGIVRVLLSGQTLARIGGKLGLSITHTGRLRAQARKLEGAAS